MAMTSTRDLLLRRRGVVFIDAPAGPPVPEGWLQGIEAEWAGLGYVPTARLRARLARLPSPELGAVHRDVMRVLALKRGAHVAHVPLFRTFPDDVPADTAALWWSRVVSHFLQAPDQPCVLCRGVGTTHVLDPCLHVACERCFAAGAPSACPVCGGRIDPSSPFVRPTPARAAPKERVVFELVDLGVDLDVEARALFVSLCERAQVLSPVDRDDLGALLRDLGERALEWLPPVIPVKENVAIVFGTLARTCSPGPVLQVARGYLKTATDVLRFLAALSGADPSLPAEGRFVPIDLEAPGRRWARETLLEVKKRAVGPMPCTRIQARRFKVAKLSRPLRRAVLELLEGFDADLLVEDMLRHRSLWVWLGRFLHPHEHAGRSPRVARAFAVVRGEAPDGTRAPRFETFNARVAAAIERRDARALTDLLRDRPGELARRLDLALRLAGADAAAAEHVLDAFVARTGKLATPVLLTLLALLPTRTRPAKVRVYFPKGDVALGPTAADTRAPLEAGLVARATGAVEAELLARFGRSPSTSLRGGARRSSGLPARIEGDRSGSRTPMCPASKPAFDTIVIDAALARIVAPFNERTASRSAVALPRGSRVDVPESKVLRLFLHWCQPERGGRRTDIDLSVGFYDARWRHVGVCSFYALSLLDGAGEAVARSSGDLTSAPFPDGASEFVDVDRARALAAGMRYAVMVVNNYSGMAFRELHRGFAGLMLRDDASGAHFDPRTVALRFDLQGDNGIYLPLVVDLAAGTLHWFDVQAKGQLELNNVSTSNRAIVRLCPALLTYFDAGERASMLDLALLHAAARCRRVVLRERDRWLVLEREPGEVGRDFLARLRGRGPRAEGQVRPPSLGPSPVLAVLHDGDLELPPGSAVYALFPGLVTSTFAASDLISS